MTAREIIRRVLEFDRPPRIGFSYSNFEGRTRLHDVASCDPRPAPTS